MHDSFAPIDPCSYVADRAYQLEFLLSSFHSCHSICTMHLLRVKLDKQRLVAFDDFYSAFRPDRVRNLFLPLSWWQLLCSLEEITIKTSLWQVTILSWMLLICFQRCVYLLYIDMMTSLGWWQSLSWSAMKIRWRVFIISLLFSVRQFYAVLNLVSSQHSTVCDSTWWYANRSQAPVIRHGWHVNKFYRQ